MSKVSLNTIKNWFKTRSKPTQNQFWDVWDSFWHKDEQISISSIENLDNRFNQKADQEAFTVHLTDADAHNLIARLAAKADVNHLHEITDVNQLAEKLATIGDLNELQTLEKEDLVKVANQLYSYIQAINETLFLKEDKVDGYGLSQENFSPELKAKLAAIDAVHYGAPLQSTAELAAITSANRTDKQRHYVESEKSDYFYDAQATVAGEGDVIPSDQADGTGIWRKVAVDGETPASIKTKLESNPDTYTMREAEKTKLSGIATGATANSTDAQLRDRSTHTGEQPISSITGLQAALDAEATARQNAYTALEIRINKIVMNPINSLI